MKRYVPAVLAVALLAAAGPARGAVVPSTYESYAGPSTLVGSAGEPSIGFDPATGATLLQANTTTAKVTFAADGTATWTDVSDPTAPISLDPILLTDRATGRTFTSQLLTACSKASYTDDDGASYTPSQGCGAGTVFDHQTIGAGPFSTGGLAGLGIYPDAVYYCAQAMAEASCAVSRDGGLTFGPGVPAYTQVECGQGLHGHLKVAPDGTALLPVFDCLDAQGAHRQAVAVSHDNGGSWTVEPVPGSTTQDESDPHVGIGAGGTVYFGYQGADGTDLGDKGYAGHAFSEGHQWVAVKPAGATTWNAPVDVDIAAAAGVKNVQFSEVIAGDDDRAAVAFLGTTTAGDDQDPAFPGVWHLYVSTTYDRGATWTTVDTTPDDPVQRGCIWLQGGSSTCRNLLDFNDITMDAQGRVLVAYADGCTGACVHDPSSTTRTELGTILRQRSGPTLLAQFSGPAQTTDPVTLTPAGPTSTAPAATTTAPGTTNPAPGSAAPGSAAPAGTVPAPAGAPPAGDSPATPASARVRLHVGRPARRSHSAAVRIRLRASGGTLRRVVVRLTTRGGAVVAGGTARDVGRRRVVLRLALARDAHLLPGRYHLVVSVPGQSRLRLSRTVRIG